MKKGILTLLVLWTCFQAAAQTLTNTALGFQEPTSKIYSMTADSSGHLYYFGVFRGGLVRNNQTLLTGNGGDDLFIVKTDTAGAVLWARNYGGAGNETLTSANTFKYAGGFLYFSALFSTTITIGGFTLEPYAADRLASCIARIDTATGDAGWVRKSSFLANGIQVAGGVIMSTGSIASSRGAISFENTLLLDSSGLSKAGFLFLDTAGNYRSLKTVYRDAGNSNLLPTIANPVITPEGRVLFMAVASTPIVNYATSLVIKDTLIPVPASKYVYAMVKTDTAFSRVEYRILFSNPSTQNVSLSNNNTQHYVRYSAQYDSLFLLVNSTSAAATYYTNDGYNVLLNNKNTLIILDSSFLTSRVQTLNFTNSKIILQNVIPYQGKLFFTGSFSGLNNAPSIVPIPANNQTLDIFGGITDVVDYNGSSKVFLAVCDADFSNKNFRWIGDLTSYSGTAFSNGNLFGAYNRIYTHNLSDDKWNTWEYDAALTVIRGAMITNADRGEITRNVRYLSDGSMIVLGEAKGRTALDSSGTGIIPTNTNASDMFIAKLNNQGQASWYKRVYSSNRYLSNSRMIMRADTAYVFITLNGSLNTNGYLKMDTTSIIYTSNGVIAILFKIYPDGTYRYVDLSSTDAGRMDNIDIFENGDIAGVTSGIGAKTINGITFTNSIGNYILRMDPNGTILKAVKYYGTSCCGLGVPDIYTNGSDSSVLINGYISYSSGITSKNLILTDGQNWSDTSTYTIAASADPVPGPFLNVIRTDFLSKKSATFLGPATTTTSIVKGCVKNNLLYLSVYKTKKVGLNVNGQVFDADTTASLYYIMAINQQGNISYHEKFTLPGTALNYPFTINKISSFGDKVYASGSLYGPMMADTIAIGYSGMVDALTIQYDTTLKAQRAFRLHSIFSETMYDCAVLNDSLISFAYTAQGIPQLQNGPSSSISAGDLDENGYVGQLLLRNASLPLNWFRFDVRRDNAMARLSWTTLNEQQTHRFVIQHSANGRTWAAIGEVSARNSQRVENYNFTHEKPQPGVNFYRILSVDLDGRQLHSPIRSLAFDLSGKGFRLLENPGKAQSFFIEVYRPGFFELTDMNGKTVWSGYLKAGLAQIGGGTRSAGGIYILHSGDESAKIVLQ